MGGISVNHFNQPYRVNGGIADNFTEVNVYIRLF